MWMDRRTVIGSSVSHAHNFYTSIDEAAIASAMASAIDGYDGYSTTYTDGNTWFIVTADSPKAGETIAVRMQEYKAGIDYAEHDHVAVADPAVPATDTATGLTEGSHCAICGEVLKAQEVTPVLMRRIRDRAMARTRRRQVVRTMIRIRCRQAARTKLSAQRQAIQILSVSGVLQHWQDVRRR